MRVLYIASEIAPFLHTSTVAGLVNKLVLSMKDKNTETRIIVPRFGVINERKYKLHKVVRLSGIKIAIGNEERSLTVKVASIPNARRQVYFIDNEDYFQRKAIFRDDNNNFFRDNDERLIFFCKGALEIVKNLAWTPDIVHCHDWLTSLIPIYLKKAYKHDPILRHAKVVYTIYNNVFSLNFGNNFIEKAETIGLADSQLKSMNIMGEEELIHLGMKYADTAVISEVLDNTSLSREDIPYITDNAQGIATYYELYRKLTGIKISD